MLNYLDYVYIYGIKQDFYVNHSSKYHTLFSSFLSIITYFLIFFFLVFFGRNIFLKNNPDFNQLEVNYDYPDLINLTNENFLFAFALQDRNYTNYIDPTIYEIEAFYVQIVQDPITKNKTKSIHSLDLIPCNKLNFSPFFTIYLQSIQLIFGFLSVFLEYKLNSFIDSTNKVPLPCSKFIPITF